MSRKRFIDGLIGKFNRGPIPKIVIDVSHRTGIAIASIVSKQRLRHIAHARQEVYALARDVGCTLREIADFFAADHTTVIHGIAAHQARTTPHGETQ